MRGAWAGAERAEARGPAADPPHANEAEQTEPEAGGEQRAGGTLIQRRQREYNEDNKTSEA